MASARVLTTKELGSIRYQHAAVLDLWPIEVRLLPQPNDTPSTLYTLHTPGNPATPFSPTRREELRASLSVPPGGLVYEVLRDGLLVSTGGLEVRRPQSTTITTTTSTFSSTTSSTSSTSSSTSSTSSKQKTHENNSNLSSSSKYVKEPCPSGAFQIPNAHPDIHGCWPLFFRYNEFPWTVRQVAVINEQTGTVCAVLTRDTASTNTSEDKGFSGQCFVPPGRFTYRFRVVLLSAPTSPTRLGWDDGAMTQSWELMTWALGVHVNDLSIPGAQPGDGLMRLEDVPKIPVRPIKEKRRHYVEDQLEEDDDDDYVDDDDEDDEGDVIMSDNDDDEDKEEAIAAEQSDVDESEKKVRKIDLQSEGIRADVDYRNSDNRHHDADVNPHDDDDGNKENVITLPSPPSPGTPPIRHIVNSDSTKSSTSSSNYNSHKSISSPSTHNNPYVQAVDQESRAESSLNWSPKMGFIGHCGNRALQGRSHAPASTPTISTARDNVSLDSITKHEDNVIEQKQQLNVENQFKNENFELEESNINEVEGDTSTTINLEKENDETSPDEIIKVIMEEQKRVQQPPTHLARTSQKRTTVPQQVQQQSQKQKERRSSGIQRETRRFKSSQNNGRKGKGNGWANVALNAAMFVLGSTVTLMFNNRTHRKRTHSFAYSDFDEDSMDLNSEITE